MKIKVSVFVLICTIGQNIFAQNDDDIISFDSLKNIDSQDIPTGLFTRSNKATTGNVIKVDQSDLIPGLAVTIDQQLQGMIPGLQIVQHSGQPGSNSWLNLRGFNSFISVDAPQIVLDGIPLQLNSPAEQFNVLQEINPADITSITVLKDGASSAIYGSRGGNGVILLSTARDKKAFYTTLETFYGWQTPFYYDLLNSEQLSSLHQQAAENNDIEPDYSGDTLFNNTDWQKELMSTQPLQNYQLSMGAGSDLFQLHFSTSYTHQNGTMANSNFERFTARINSTFTPISSLQVGLNAFTSFTNAKLADQGYENSVIGAMLKAHPGMPVKDENGNYKFDVSPSYSLAINPLLASRSQDINKSSDRVMGNFFLNYEILPVLKITANTGMNIAETKFRHFTDNYLFTAPNFSTTLKENQTSPDFYMYNFLLNYKINQKNFSFEFTGGYVFESTYFNNNSTTTTTYFDGQDLPNNNMFGSIMKADAKLKSWIGNGDLAFMNKYYLTLSARHEGSSFFNNTNKWQMFPGVAVGWDIKQEPFLQKNNTINRLSFSASYGKNGVPTNSPDEATNINFTAIGTGNSIANPDLEFPMVNQFDFGISGTLLSTIDFSINYYHKNIDNSYLLTLIPSGSGIAQFLTNAGVMTNYGWEMGLGTNVSSSRLKWNTYLNLASNINLVGQLGEDENPHVIPRGEPIHSFFGYRYEGVYKTTNNQWGKAGEPIIADIGLNGIIDGSDRTIIGNPHPDVFGGWSHHLQYGRFDFRMLFHFALGQEIFNFTKAKLSGFKGNFNTTTDALNAWSLSNPGGNLPEPGYKLLNLFQESSWHIEDASFFSLRTLRIGYHMQFSSLKTPLFLFANFDNLFTFTKYSGPHPDVIPIGNPGIDFFSYPGYRGYALGLRFAL